MVASPAAAARLPDGGRFAALDALRGIAALGVAFYHIKATSGLAAQPWHEGLPRWVDFFFVLSGFVIAAAYGERLGRGFSVLRFMVLRTGRLYPLHLAVLLIYLAAEFALFASGLTAGGRTAFSGPRDAALLVPSLLLIQAFTHPGLDMWNVQSWSISVELWLYLGAAVLWRLTGRMAGWIALIAALAALGLAELRPDLFAVQGWALRGLAGFGLGLAGWQFAGRGQFGARIAPWAEGLAAAALVWVFAARPGLAAADAAFLGAVLVFAREAGPISRLLRCAPLIALGTVSYSLYMMHGFVIGRMLDLADAAGWASGDVLIGPAWRSNLLAAAMLLVVMGAAWLGWRLIEEPARAASRKLAVRWGAGGEEAAAPAI